MGFEQIMVKAISSIVFVLSWGSCASAMYDPHVGRFASRDPTGFEGSRGNLLEVGFGRVSTFLDPTGQVPIKCVFERGGLGGLGETTITTDCLGSATACCDSVKPPGGWKLKEWHIENARPDSPSASDTCPDNWSVGTDYLTCVSCCVKKYEFWNSAAIACGIGGIRVPKPHIQPGQYPGQTWLYGPRRCLPSFCRPKLWQVRLTGRCSGILFIIEGCYDVGVEGTCATFCATR